MNKQFRLFFLLLVTLPFAACVPEPIEPAEPGKPFILYVNNEIGPLDAHIGVWLSDENGKVLAFRWVDGNDTARIMLPEIAESRRLDCTVAQITTIDASGSGVRDTAIHLKTYTALRSGETLNLRNLIYQQVTDLRIQFTNLNTLDSIIVPDGLTFSKPQAGNNFYGQYRIIHTGKFWVRVKVNGEPKWRFLQFNDINTDDITATVDVQLLPIIFSHSREVALPFSAAWSAKVNGITNLDSLLFFPMGDILRAPGGAVPVFNVLSFYEPIINEDFDPGPKPYSGFRISVSGKGNASEGYFASDKLYSTLPASIGDATFDVMVTPSLEDRFGAAIGSGDFDVLVFSRAIAGTPSVLWDAMIPGAAGTLYYRLPDLPQAVADLSPKLAGYQFGNQVQAYGESFANLSGYDAVTAKRLQNDDPLWQAKAAYTAKGR